MTDSWIVHHDAIIRLNSENIICECIYSSDTEPKQYDDYIGARITNGNFDGSYNSARTLEKFKSLDGLYAKNPEICKKHKITALFQNGEFIAEYLNGKLHGKFKSATEEGNYINGKKQGEWNLHSASDSRYFRATLNYVDGALNGEANIASDNARGKGSYVNNKKVGVWNITRNSNFVLRYHTITYDNGVPIKCVTAKDYINPTIVRTFEGRHQIHASKSDQFSVDDYWTNWEYGEEIEYWSYTNKLIKRHKTPNEEKNYRCDSTLESIRTIGKNDSWNTTFWPDGKTIKYKEIPHFQMYGLTQWEKIWYHENGVKWKETFESSYFREYTQSSVMIYECSTSSNTEFKKTPDGQLIYTINKPSTSEYKRLLSNLTGDVDRKNIYLYTSYNLDGTKSVVSLVSRNLCDVVLSSVHRWSGNPHLCYKFIGELTEFYSNGISIKLIKTYGNYLVNSNWINGLHGNYKEFFENGNVKVSGKYFQNNKVGRWVTYDEENNEMSSEVFVVN